jgi:hypothetical protein
MIDPDREGDRTQGGEKGSDSVELMRGEMACPGEQGEGSEDDVQGEEQIEAGLLPEPARPPERLLLIHCVRPFRA